MELSKIQYFLVEKRSSKKVELDQQAKELQQNVSNILVDLVQLGYKEREIEDVRNTLLNSYSHPLFAEKSNSNKLTSIGSYYPEWKPAFSTLNGCSADLPSLLEELNKESIQQEIIKVTIKVNTNHIDYEDYDPERIQFRIEPRAGWCEDKFLLIEKEYVSIEQFISEMKNYEWNKFGMPKEYNPTEETIWE